MTKLNRAEIFRLITYLEYEMYKHRKNDMDNELTQAIKKLYLELWDKLDNIIEIENE